MGTPDFAVAALDAIVSAGHEVICVYCQPPRPAGRGHKLHPSAVETRAHALNLPVRSPLSLKKNAEARAAFVALNADIAVVAAYGLILPQEVLDAPRYGCLNIHASLLPRWRGASPIQHAILSGDDKSGITIMQMEAGLDTGPALIWESVAITNETTASSLHDALADIGGRLIVKTLDMIASSKPPAPRKQDDAQATYAGLLTKDDGRVDWTKGAVEIERQSRALTPWPGVWCLHSGQRLKVLEAKIASGKAASGTIVDDILTIACGEGALSLVTVQPQDRKPMSGADFMNGARLKPGDTLS